MNQSSPRSQQITELLWAVCKVFGMLMIVGGVLSFVQRLADGKDISSATYAVHLTIVIVGGWLLAFGFHRTQSHTDTSDLIAFWARCTGIGLAAINLTGLAGAFIFVDDARWYDYATFGAFVVFGIGLIVYGNRRKNRKRTG